MQGLFYRGHNVRDYAEHGKGYRYSHDFPGGEWRRVQRARGYRSIIVNGVETFAEGDCTGATPGRLLRHGRVYPGKSTWTQAHHRWLAGQCFDNANSELAYLDYLAAVDGLVARRRALDERLSRLAVEGDWWPTVQRLRSFRGLDTLSALVLALEVGDFARFRSPRQLASWLGLVPSLSQSGESSTQGAITKTGSRYARRLLVEAAWHYGRPPRIGVTLRQRQDGQPAHVLQIAWRCQHRLYRLHQLLSQRHKPGNIVTVALARSLACYLWAAAVAP